LVRPEPPDGDSDEVTANVKDSITLDFILAYASSLKIGVVISEWSEEEMSPFFFIFRSPYECGITQRFNGTAQRLRYLFGVSVFAAGKAMEQPLLYVELRIGGSMIVVEWTEDRCFITIDTEDV
jgi:hypothetical protein